MDAFDSIYRNDIQSLREYLELGDVNKINERGISLLHAAILFNNSEIFNLLLENYIDINIKDNNGQTPAHYCVMNNRIGFLKMLIRHNANLTIKDYLDESPLYKACLLGKENMISLLLETLSFDIYEKNSKDETIFMALVRSRNLDLLNKINLDEEIVNMPNYQGETPLHIAAKAGDLSVVNYLISNKAFIHAKTNQGETPIFYAIRGQNLDVVDLLLKHGALMDTVSKFHDTAYDLVIKPDILAYINEKEEKYNCKRYILEFPLHYAIIKEDLVLVNEYNTLRNKYREDIYGFTPLKLAKKLKNEKIIKLLK